MPSIGRIVSFLVMATVTVVVGNYIYGKFVGPLISGVMKKAA